jgi:hypothetical protein
MIHERRSTHCVPDIVHLLEGTAAESDPGAFGTLDLRAKMSEEGLPIGSNCVAVKLCSSAQARRVHDLGPTASTSQPYRASVCSKDDRNAVDMISPTVFFQSFENGEILPRIAEELERSLIRVIDTVRDVMQHAMARALSVCRRVMNRHLHRSS